MSLEERAATINAKKPDLTAEVFLYPIEDGGRRSAIQPGYGCPCFSHKDKRESGWDGWMQLGDREFAPGETRKVGFCFLSGEKAVRALEISDVFYLWEGKIIGEATIIHNL